MFFFDFKNTFPGPENEDMLSDFTSNFSSGTFFLCLMASFTEAVSEELSEAATIIAFSIFDVEQDKDIFLHFIGIATQEDPERDPRGEKFEEPAIYRFDKRCYGPKGDGRPFTGRGVGSLLLAGTQKVGAVLYGSIAQSIHCEVNVQDANPSRWYKLHGFTVVEHSDVDEWVYNYIPREKQDK